MRSSHVIIKQTNSQMIWKKEHMAVYTLNLCDETMLRKTMDKLTFKLYLP